MEKNRRKIRWYAAAVFFMVLALCAGGVTALASEKTAASMRLSRTEGTVEVTNKNGRNMGTKADMKLFSGYQVSTGEESYAWMNLDDETLAKLDAYSASEIRKNGKELEIFLTSGNLFFHVMEPLAEDETLNIRTSTMVTGIRGTAGWVKIINERQTRLYVLEGQVQCMVADPVTGQMKRIVLQAGQVADFVVYDKTKIGDKCDIFLGRYTEEDVDGFVAAEPSGNRTLCEKIRRDSGLDPDKIIAGAADRLKKDRELQRQKQKEILTRVYDQDHNVIEYPKFKRQEERDTNDRGGNSGGSFGGNKNPVRPTEPARPANPTGPTDPTEPTSPTEPVNPTDPTEPEEPESDTIVLTMPVTAKEVHEYLQVKRVVIINAGTGDNTLFIDYPVVVPAGKFLTMNEGVHMDVGAEPLQINGTLDMAGNVMNGTTITNTSMNTFKVGGTFENNGIIENTGRIVAASGIRNTYYGIINNSGVIEGAVTAEGGTMSLKSGGSLDTKICVEGDGIVLLQGGTVPGAEISGGTLKLETGTLAEITVTGGTAVVNGTVPSASVSGGILSVESGTLSEVRVDGGELEAKGGLVSEVSVNGGTLHVNGGNVPTAAMRDGKVIVESGTLSEARVNGGLMTVKGSVVPAVYLNEGELQMVGGTVAKTEILAGTGRAAGGTMEQVTVKGGSLETESGTITNAEIAAGMLKVSGGIVETAVIESGNTFVNGGTVTSLERKGGDSLSIDAGTVKTLKNVTGDVTISGGAVENFENIAGSVNISDGTVAAINMKAGTLAVSGGAVDAIEVEAGAGLSVNGGMAGSVGIPGGEAKIYGGEIGTVLVNQGTLRMEGGTVTDGITAEGEGSCVEVQGGEILAGKASTGAAITVDIPGAENQKMLPDAANVVLRSCIVDGDAVGGNTADGGTVDGDDVGRDSKKAVLVKSGIVRLENPGDKDKMTRIMAVDVNDLMVLGDGTAGGDTGSAAIFWKETDSGYQSITNETIFVCARSEGKVIPKAAYDTVAEALENAGPDDVVMLKRNYEQESDTALRIAKGSVTNPVVLDLNGCRYSSLRLSLEEDADGGLRICDRLKQGTVETAKAVEIGTGGSLQVDGGVRMVSGTNSADGQTVLKIGGGTAVLGEETEGELAVKPAVICSDNKSDSPLVRISDGNLIINNAKIVSEFQGYNSAAVDISGPSQTVMNAGAELVSESEEGTLKIAFTAIQDPSGWVSYNNGSISNENRAGAAIYLSQQGNRTESTGLIPSNIGSDDGTDVKGKGETLISFGGTGDIMGQNGYTSKWESDGYYHVRPAGTAIATFSNAALAATSSNAYAPSRVASSPETTENQPKPAATSSNAFLPVTSESLQSAKPSDTPEEGESPASGENPAPVPNGTSPAVSPGKKDEDGKESEEA